MTFSLLFLVSFVVCICASPVEAIPQGIFRTVVGLNETTSTTPSTGSTTTTLPSSSDTTASDQSPDSQVPLQIIVPVAAVTLIALILLSLYSQKHWKATQEQRQCKEENSMPLDVTTSEMMTFSVSLPSQSPVQQQQLSMSSVVYANKAAKHWAHR